jgi:peptidyl-prolyl cis-trans isomerase A (cyclophilin A)
LTPKENPIVMIKTSLGDIKVEVNEKKAPITAKNFLRYVDEGRFDGTSFFRVVTMENQPNSPVKIEVIQGGIPGVRGKGYPSVYPPIEHETTQKTGILHKDGTISMARSSPPNTATSSFFICINDQPELDYMGKRNPDLHGFAAFGQVTEGMDVVRKIHKQPYEGQRFKPPLEISSIRRV